MVNMKIQFCLCAFSVAPLQWLTKIKPFFLNPKIDDERLHYLGGNLPYVLIASQPENLKGEANGLVEVAVHLTEDRSSNQGSREKVQSECWKEVIEWKKTEVLASLEFLDTLMGVEGGGIDYSCTPKRQVRGFDPILKWQMCRSKTRTSMPGTPDSGRWTARAAGPQMGVGWEWGGFSPRRVRERSMPESFSCPKNVVREIQE